MQIKLILNYSALYACLLCVLIQLVTTHTQAETKKSPTCPKIPSHELGATPKKITFHNQAKGKIGFYCYTKYGESVEFYIEPNAYSTVSFDSPGWIIQLSSYQTPYYLDLTRDSIDIKTSAKDIAYFYPKHENDKIKLNELSAFAYAGERMSQKENIFYISVLKQDAFDKAERLIRQKYQEAKHLFTEYITNHQVSAGFQQSAETQMLLVFYKYELYLIAKSKKALGTPPAFYKHIDSITNILQSDTTFTIIGPPAFDADYQFFKYRTQKRTSGVDSLIYIYKLQLAEIKNPAIFNKILFLLTKDALTENDSTKDEIVALFNAQCNDDNYRNFIQTLIADNHLKENIANADVLLTLSKTGTTLAQIIKSNPGKILYIDIWASWCAPCRQEMPFSVQLRNLYKDKKVAFVFISQDENFTAWKKASAQENLSGENGNYIMPAFQQSLLKKQYDIVAIPRYLLIDQNGTVVNFNAPRPSDPQLRIVFDKLLSK